MPFSKKQQVTAAIALHSPEKLKKKNKGMLGMSKSQLHDFASGPIEKKRPVIVRKKSQ
jgi:hypothetical protein